MRKFINTLAAILIVGAVAGATYERIGKQRDRKRLPRIGQAVDVGGRSLNIYCLGSGSPTVVLDTGGSAPGYSNMPLQKLISRETRTCWFDRAGLGWSDASAVTQTSGAIASDLHDLLRGAQVFPPYILVGQSFSGFNVRVFTKSYPSEVAGLVLLDSVQEDQQQYEPRSTLGFANRLPALVRGVLCRTAPLAQQVGLVRLLMSGLGSNRRVPPGFSQSEAALLHQLESQPKALVAPSGCGAWEESAKQAHAAGNLGDIPLVVLTGGKPPTIGDPAADQEIRTFHEIWVHQLQPRLASLSTRGKQVIVADSGHGIASDKPDVVVETIRQMLLDIRRQLAAIEHSPAL